MHSRVLLRLVLGNDGYMQPSIYISTLVVPEGAAWPACQHRTYVVRTGLRMPQESVQCNVDGDRGMMVHLLELEQREERRWGTDGVRMRCAAGVA